MAVSGGVLQPDASTNINGDMITTKEMNKGGNEDVSNFGIGGGVTKIVDTMGTKIKDTVVLVCLGDSRGFVHMNHLILK